MAHFAQIENGIVTHVIKVHNNELLDNGVESEAKGIAFCKSLFGQDTVWKQTSYNTAGGVHLLGGTPFRKNYAEIGGTYDETRDAFIPVKVWQSWVFNENTCLWEAPIPLPNDGNSYSWNEETLSWDQIPTPIPYPTDGNSYTWNEETRSWDLLV